LLREISFDENLPVVTEFKQLMNKLREVNKFDFQYQNKGYSMTAQELIAYLGQEGGSR
jgi:hypothetical protein